MNGPQPDLREYPHELRLVEAACALLHSGDPDVTRVYLLLPERLPYTDLTMIREACQRLGCAMLVRRTDIVVSRPATADPDTSPSRREMIELRSHGGHWSRMASNTHVIRTSHRQQPSQPTTPAPHWKTWIHQLATMREGTR